MKLSNILTVYVVILDALAVALLLTANAWNIALSLRQSGQ